jgi:hypothetical protein
MGPASAVASRLGRQLDIVGTSDEEEEDFVRSMALWKSQKEAQDASKHAVPSSKTQDSPPAHKKPLQESPAKNGIQTGEPLGQKKKRSSPQSNKNKARSAQEQPKSNGTKRKRAEPDDTQMEKPDSSANRTSTGTGTCASSSDKAPMEDMPDYNSMDIEDLKRIVHGYGLKASSLSLLEAAVMLFSLRENGLIDSSHTSGCCTRIHIYTYTYTYMYAYACTRKHTHTPYRYTHVLIHAHTHIHT